MKRAEWSATTSDLTEIFNISRQTVSDWCRKGLPKRGTGKFDFREVIKWWFENIYPEKTKEDETLQNIRKRYWSAKADAEEIKVQIQKKELIPVEEIAKAFAWRIQELKTGLTQWCSRLPQMLEGKKAEEIQKILEKELYDVLSVYSRGDKYTCRKK